MTSPGELVPAPAGALQPWVERSALEQLPKRQALWIVGATAAATVTAALPLWAVAPELALALALGAGASLVDPRRLWAAPLVIAAVGLAGLLCIATGIPAVIGAGATAGALATVLFPHRTDWLDVVHGALGSLAGASIGLWVATMLIPAATPTVLAAALTGALVTLLGAQGLLPVALRFDQAPQLPTAREIAKALKIQYRPPVFRALDLYGGAQAQAPDRDTRRGMAEVATWVFRLEVTLQTLDTELAQIDPEQVRARIDSHTNLAADVDEFTRERRQATVVHLERLLQHRRAIEIERSRTEALVDYALAFLEEARAGLAVARELPGEASPERLPEVLHRLRHSAQEGDARRRTARELGSMQV
ncbi:MAG: hypothetical protein ABMB14_03155 [Myxococcota bacterium]